MKWGQKQQQITRSDRRREISKRDVGTIEENYAVRESVPVNDPLTISADRARRDLKPS